LENEGLDPFVLDQNKIAMSKAFRRLGDKAQVLPNAKEENVHMRNRMTHSLEVAELSAIFCDMMNIKFANNKIPIRVNKELCRAIALGHDIGHTPFGHMGERFISQKT
jgi:dGTPase